MLHVVILQSEAIFWFSKTILLSSFANGITAQWYSNMWSYQGYVWVRVMCVAACSSSGEG